MEPPAQSCLVARFGLSPLLKLLLELAYLHGHQIFANTFFIFHASKRSELR